MDITDNAALLKRAADGDDRAWTALVDRHNNLLWAVARSFRLDDADAADAVQTAWLRLVENLGRLQEPDRVGAWLVTTTRRESLRLLQRGRREVLVGPDLQPEPVDRDPPVDSRLLHEERDRALWEAMLQLSDLCQRLLRVLMADPPPSYRDVSAALDMPVGSIGPRRARCLDKLREQVLAHGLSDETRGPA